MGSRGNDEPVLIVIPDAYSSGRLYPDRARAYGERFGRTVHLAHVHSQGSPPPKFKASYQAECFDYEIPFGQPEEIASSIREHAKKIGASQVVVLPGAEGGVALADELSMYLTDLGAPVSPPNKAKRDKRVLARVLREHGIDHAHGEEFTDAQAALRWIEKQGYFARGERVVVKPPEGAGGEDLIYCSHPSEVGPAVEAILQKTNVWGVVNDAALVQEELIGREFVYDAVTRVHPHTRERHTVTTDIWVYKKRIVDGRSTYWTEHLLDFESKVQRRLGSYLENIVNALGIEVGVLHAEIFLTSRGPVIVDLGFRPAGAQNPLLVEEVTGHSQIDIGLLAYLDPDAFFKLPVSYQRKQRALIYTLSNRNSGRRLEEDAGTVLRRTPGYRQHSFYAPQGRPLPVTRDLLTAPGDVWIAGSKDTVTTAQRQLAALDAYDRLTRDLNESPPVRQ